MGIPAGDELRSRPNKPSLPSSSLACGLPSPAFIGNDGRIELSYSVGLPLDRGTLLCVLTFILF